MWMQESSRSQLIRWRGWQDPYGATLEQKELCVDKTKRCPVEPASAGRGEREVEFCAMETEEASEQRWPGASQPWGPEKVNTTWNWYEPLFANFSGSAKFPAPKISELSRPMAWHALDSFVPQIFTAHPPLPGIPSPGWVCKDAPRA